MDRKGVLPMVAVFAAFCFAGTSPCRAETNWNSSDSRLAQLYVRLLGTSP